jgi:nucleoside-diphosphate-sugar epimerase
MPDGQEYRAYDLSKLAEAGFKPRVPLAEGLRTTYDWYAARAGRTRD